MLRLFLQFCILRKVVRFAAMANIFLLEDDKILSKGISIALKKDEHMVTAVYGYLEALKQYQKQKYDLFLLDINLPDGNGLEFCEKIRETSETPVLFLTANDTEEDMLEGFGVGCDDYISKPFSIEVLRKKVLAVLKRSGVGKFRMKYRDLELDKEKCLVLMKGQEIHLTSTEYKLLLYLMENRGRVVTKAMLLEQLWDIDGNFVDDNTVRVNIKRLRQKLNDEKQEYIVTVFGMGYYFWRMTMKHFGIYRKLILIIGTATAVVSVGVFFFMEDILFRTLFIVFCICIFMRVCCSCWTFCTTAIMIIC